MNISYQELRAFEDFIQRCEDGVEKKYASGRGGYWHDIDFRLYYANHPHLLLPLGFDEYVAFKNKKEFSHLWFADWMKDTQRHSIYRQPSGQWFLLGSAATRRNERFGFDTKETAIDYGDDYALEFPLEDLFQILYKIAGKSPLEEEKPFGVQNYGHHLLKKNNQ